MPALMDISQPIFSLKASKQTEEKYFECNSHRKKEGKELLFVSQKWFLLGACWVACKVIWVHVKWFLLGTYKVVSTGCASCKVVSSGYMKSGRQVQWTIPTSGSEDCREEWEEKADINSLFTYVILKYWIWAPCFNINY